MLDIGPDQVLAFAAKTSRGTRGCVAAGRKWRLTLEIHQPARPIQRFFWPPLAKELI